MDAPTSDPGVVIESRDESGVVYRSVTGRRWRVNGECNRCGLCVVGAVPIERWTWRGPPGTPGAVFDTLYGSRLDEPVTPEFFPAMERIARETPTALVTGCSMTLGKV